MSETNNQNVRFVHCANKDIFLEKLAASEFDKNSIVFIAQEKLIWTQTDSTEDFYDCSNHEDIRAFIDELSEKLESLENAHAAFEELVAGTYALKTQVTDVLKEAKTYADGLHSAIPTSEITALFA